MATKSHCRLREARSSRVTMEDSLEMNCGTQPLDALMEASGLTNHDLVASEIDQVGLTHKVVQKARKGRALTTKAQVKVLAALNAALKRQGHPPVVLAAVFNYRGR
jgi:hypothetical protein